MAHCHFELLVLSKPPNLSTLTALTPRILGQPSAKVLRRRLDLERAGRCRWSPRLWDLDLYWQETSMSNNAERILTAFVVIVAIIARRTITATAHVVIS